MLTLLSLLQVRRDWPGPTLAARLQVTPRTVRRDIERLRAMGYRIRSAKGIDGGYRLEPGEELPPLLFDDEQAVAIAVALQNAATSGVRIADAAERALATIRQVMPSRLRHRLDGIRFAPGGGEAATTSVDPALIEVVSAAVNGQLTLRFDYRGVVGGVGDVPPRRVEPHGLVARRGRWYLVAWCLDRAAWRVFRLDRMSPRTPLGPAFVPRALPTIDAATFVEARTKGSDGPDAWPCAGTFEVALPAHAVAPWVEDGGIEPSGPHSCTVTMGSWSWTGLVAAALRFDAPVRMISPAALVAEAARLSVRLADASQDAASSGGQTTANSSKTMGSSSDHVAPRAAAVRCQ